MKKFIMFFAVVVMAVSVAVTQNRITKLSLSQDVINKSVEGRFFIPDGPYCMDSININYPLVVSEFPEGDTIVSGDDIRSVCINMEHSYLGDLEVSLVCPNGKSAILKNKDRYPRLGGGGSTYLGFPLDRSGWDGDIRCDSLYNPFGVGLDYCFSRSEGYTLVTGYDAAEVWTESNIQPDCDCYITTTLHRGEFNVTYDSIPDYFMVEPGTVPPDTIFTRVKLPSNHETRTGYFLPADSFGELVGCPFNGEWKLCVRDMLSADNGWVFGWDIDFRNVFACDEGSVVHDTVYISVGIDRADGADVKVFATDGRIVVEGSVTLPAVSVYDIGGRELAAMPTPAGGGVDGQRMVFEVPSSGTYMVKVGDSPAHKVVVLR